MVTVLLCVLIYLFLYTLKQISEIEQQKCKQYYPQLLTHTRYMFYYNVGFLRIKSNILTMLDECLCQDRQSSNDSFGLNLFISFLLHALLIRYVHCCLARECVAPNPYTEMLLTASVHICRLCMEKHIV